VVETSIALNEMQGRNIHDIELYSSTKIGDRSTCTRIDLYQIVFSTKNMKATPFTLSIV